MKSRFTKKVLVLLLAASLLFPTGSLAAGTSDSSMEYLKTIMDEIKQNYGGTVTDQQLLEGAVKGMYGTMDPYTTFFDRDEADSFMSQVGGKFSGIGVSLNKSGDGDLLITSVFQSSPAEKAGIMSGDRIISIDGQSISGLTIEQAVSLIKGVDGSTVNIGIMRAGSSKEQVISVKRGEIVVNPVSYSIRDGVGYIKIDSFNSNTAVNFDKALAEMDKNSITKIVLDLRNNPGGEVGQAVSVARRLVPKGLITKLNFKSPEYKNEEFYSALQSPKYKLAVLVNEMSASASEILSGAIQDTKAGTLIGTKTFGKAKVQATIPLLTPDATEKYKKLYNAEIVDASDLVRKYKVDLADEDIMGLSKITIGQYTTPNGRMIDKIGLKPDIEVENYRPVNSIDVNSI
ncbi:MAG TPA: S41 family peptidase, partial [Clostridia bacterium]